MQIRSASNTNEVNWDDPLNKGLVAWMPMGQNGRPVVDLVSGGVGVPSGGPSTELNNATRQWGVDLDGVDDYITIPHHPIQNTISDQITISWWSKISTGDSGGVIAKYNTASNRSWSVRVNEAAGFAQKTTLYTSSNGTSNESEIYSSYSAIDEWQHHVLSWNAGVGRVLYNGDLTNIGTATHTAETSIFAGTADLVIGARYNALELLDGQLSDIRVYNRALSDAEMRELYEASVRNYPTQFKRRSIPFGVTISGAQAYTLTADTGSFTLTGNSVDPDADRQLVAATGAFTLSGTATDLDADRQLTASTGAYTLTGNDAILTKSSFSKFVADTGAFTLTGNDTALKADHDVAASTGSYTLTGNAVALPADRQLVADAASFSLTGNDATLTYAPTDPTLTAATGSFTETGNDATLTVSRKLAANTTSYTVAGNDTATKASHKFLATVASFDLDGPAVNLQLSRRIALDTLTYNLTGVNTRLSYSEADVSSIIQATSASIRCPQASGSISCADSDGTFVTP